MTSPPHKRRSVRSHLAGGLCSIGLPQLRHLEALIRQIDDRVAVSEVLRVRPEPKAPVPRVVVILSDTAVADKFGITECLFENGAAGVLVGSQSEG